MVPLSDVVFAFDFSRIEVLGGVRHLWDYGPNGFHFAFPGGAADPTPQLDGSLSFDGGDYLALPAARLAEFYQKMPTREHTWLVRFLSSSSDATVRRFFSCDNAGGGGLFKGVAYAHRGQTAIQYAFAYSGTAVQNYEFSASAEPYLFPNRSHVAVTTVETAPRGMHNQTVASYSWPVGAFGTIVYDPAQPAWIGTDTSATRQFTGRISYLALIRGALSSPDLALMSRLISEGVQKPFCVRQ